MSEKIAIKWQHTYGSPWWFASTADEGFWVGICEYRAGLFRIYTADSKDVLQTGGGWLETTERSLKAAKADGEQRIAILGAIIPCGK